MGASQSIGRFLWSLVGGSCGCSGRWWPCERSDSGWVERWRRTAAAGEDDTDVNRPVGCKPSSSVRVHLYITGRSGERRVLPPRNALLMIIVYAVWWGSCLSVPCFGRSRIFDVAPGFLGKSLPSAAHSDARNSVHSHRDWFLCSTTCNSRSYSYLIERKREREAEGNYIVFLREEKKAKQNEHKQ